MKRRGNNRGITLVEVIIGAGIVAAVTVATSFAVSLFIDTANLTVHNTRALFLAEEGITLTQYLRSEAWANITSQTLGADRYLSVSTSSVSFTGSIETLPGGYTRTLVFSSLYRNSDNDIVESTDPGAVADPGARMVEVTVDHPEGSVSLESIITNLHNE